MTREEFDTYTNNKLETICPYCGEENEHDAESLTWNDDESGEVTCGACDRDYWQICSISYSRKSMTLEEVLEDEIRSLKNDIRHSEKEPRYAKFCQQWREELEIFDLLTSNQSPDFKLAMKAFLITCIGAVLMIAFFGVCEWYGLNYLTF